MNFSDPFGLCPKHAGGDGKTETAADCSREVLDAWAQKNVVLGEGATWDGVDPALRDAVTMTSITMNAELTVYSTTNGTHAPNSFHYHGLGVDISRVNGRKLLEMGVGERNQTASNIAGLMYSYIPAGRQAELIGPHFSLRFYRGPWSNSDAQKLQRAHMSHVHASILSR